MDCWRICYLAVFQYAVPRKSFTRKFSSLRKSLIEILTQKNLLIEVLNFFLKKPHIPKVAELTATKNELILVLQNNRLKLEIGFIVALRKTLQFLT